MLKAYYRLTKPGIIYGNLVSAVAGFLLASRGHVDLGLFAAMVAGTALVIASGCVLNNYTDRDVDQKMARTRQRALVCGTISGFSALAYGTVLGVLGFAALVLFTNPLTVLVGAIGFVDYVVFYAIAKRLGPAGTIVGSISGATPLVAGYVAVTDRIDAGAVLLFLIMVIWQMPHFYAIAIFRLKDYAAAGLPVLPVKKGARAAKISIIAYIGAYIVAATALTAFGYTGYTYALVMAGVGLAWLHKALGGLAAKDDAVWARKLFGFSLIVLLTFCAMIAADTWLP